MTVTAFTIYVQCKHFTVCNTQWQLVFK